MGGDKNDAPSLFSSKGAWNELKQKILSAIHTTIKAKNHEMIISEPLITSTPASKVSSSVAAAASTTVPSTSSDSSAVIVARDESPPQNLSFKESEENQVIKSYRLIEYVLKNVKDLDRVSGIKISIERRFNEIR